MRIITIIPDDLHAAATALAESRGETLSALMRRALLKALPPDVRAGISDVRPRGRPRKDK